MASRSQPECAATPATSGPEPSAAFTPGPWVVWGHTTIARRPPGAFFHTKDAIATVHQVGDWHANARLIAASPRMFAFVARRAAEGDPEARQIVETQS